jgi:hypothetical protein
MTETLVTHTPAEKTIITFFMFQMAKLEGSMSTNFGEMAVKRKDRKLTCEARSIANLSQGPVHQKSRDTDARRKRSFISAHGGKMDAHPNGFGPSLQIVTNQCAEEK